MSLALLTLMERLTPAERAVFVLREAFAYSHRQIAEFVHIAANPDKLSYLARQFAALSHLGTPLGS